MHTTVATSLEVLGMQTQTLMLVEQVLSTYQPSPQPKEAVLIQGLSKFLKFLLKLLTDST